MPKGFTERERGLIQAALLAQGRAAFAAHGLRKTTVDDLATAAGISKGAFYLFFESKEALFFELLEQIEAELKQQLLAKVAQLEGDAQSLFLALLRYALAMWRDHPLLAGFSREEYEYLLRRLPEERVQAHLRADDRFAVELIAALERAGVRVSCAPELLAGLFKALFLVDLHADEFSAGQYPAVRDRLITMLARELVEV